MYSEVRKKSDCKAISEKRIREIFELKKQRHLIPMYCPLYHISSKWFKITMNIYKTNDKSILIKKINCNYNQKISKLMARRRKDAIYELYNKNKLKFPMILCYGYFIKCDNLDQSKYFEINDNELLKLNYFVKYLKVTMVLLQKRHLFCTYNVYPHYLDKDKVKGCYYEIELNHNL